MYQIKPGLEIERSADVKNELVVVFIHAIRVSAIFRDRDSGFAENAKSVGKEITETEMRAKIAQSEVQSRIQIHGCGQSDDIAEIGVETCLGVEFVDKIRLVFHNDRKSVPIDFSFVIAVGTQKISGCKTKGNVFPYTEIGRGMDARPTVLDVCRYLKFLIAFPFVGLCIGKKCRSQK